LGLTREAKKLLSELWSLQKKSVITRKIVQVKKYSNARFFLASLYFIN